jgi:hypothetical protein
MSRSKPIKITVEFEDGSKTEADFAALTDQLRFELLRQPAFSRPSPNPGEEKYVLLEWTDGWKEVVQVDSGCTEINRYYVITRPEDVGRLSLKKGEDYPELIEVTRDPLNLQKILFVDGYELSPERSDREGKKVDHFFSLEKKDGFLSEIIDLFREVVDEAGLTGKDLRSKDPDQIRDLCQNISRKMGIKATLRQQDLFDFIAYLAKLDA